MTQTTPQPVTPPQIVPQKATRPSISDWAKAVAHAEGARPDLNNPGDLKISTLTKSWGCKPGFTAKDGGTIGRFDTYEQGFTALCNFLTLGAENELIAFHQSRTLGTFMKVYGNPPNDGYQLGIAKELGVAVDYPVADFLNY